MQKVLLLLPLFLAAWNSHAVAQEKDTVEVNNVRYICEGTKASVVSRASGKYSGNIVVSDTVRTKAGVLCTVTSVAKNAFQSCVNLRKEKHPTTISTIGEGAFNRCSPVDSLYIP